MKVDYAAIDIGVKSSFGFWKIDDVDNSFYTQPFLVKYSRQDIYLSVMVSFYIPNSEDEGPATSSVILKFELIYIPTLGNAWTDVQDSSDDTDLIPVHEFRIPHRALLGLHSYCPVHFDALHSALVDLTIHIVYLKAAVTKSSLKPLEQSFGSKSYGIVKASLISREILLEEVKKISNAVGSTLEDLDRTDLTLGKYETVQPSKSASPSYSYGQGTPTKCSPQMTGILRDFLESSGVVVGSTDDILLYTLSEEELFELFQIVSSQLSFIWNEFLKFHRTHKDKVMGYLHDMWDINRKAEWSIWIIHSKIEIPHRYLRSMNDDSPRHLIRISSSRKVHHDPIQNSMSQAELHRKSIAQMKINTPSVQDMHIYADPSCIPVVRIEQHVMVIPQHCSSKDFLTDASEPARTIVPPPLLQGQSLGEETCGFKSGRILRAVIFVHGFQGHHLDLRLVKNQWLLLDPGAEIERLGILKKWVEGSLMNTPEMELDIISLHLKYITAAFTQFFALDVCETNGGVRSTFAHGLDLFVVKIEIKRYIQYPSFGLRISLETATSLQHLWPIFNFCCDHTNNTVSFP
ncbi:hypothetical protein ACJX0J_022313, partial [Zea mays]